MATAFQEPDRRLLPRWRESRRTESAELATDAPEADFYDSTRFEEAKQDWLRERTVAHASELVGAAIVNRHTEEVREAAEQILREAPQASNLHRLAQRALRGSEASPPLEEPPDKSRARAAKLKRRLREDPRNAVALVDLAREYSVLGQSGQAVVVIDRAVALARDNRFVLRAACALFTHIGDHDRAIQLLRRSSASRHDPWLMAAEIAASEVAGRPSATAKGGQRLLKSGRLEPMQAAELAGALATEELIAGANRSAKKLFASALVDPNENTVAQAEWASEHLAGLPLEPRHFRVLNSFEARAREKRAAGKWAAALEEARGWLFDQPFSVAPAAFASYIAGTALDDQREAERLARMGLQANPKDRMLKNNLVVALAINGKVDEAFRVFKSIDPSVGDSARRATLLATAGLLRYRSGSPGEARKLYQQAIEILAAPGLERLKALAALYRAREEILARGDFAHQYLGDARAFALKSDAPETAAFAGVIESLAASRGIMAPP
jgi:Tfp pilus assembly protein PilF